MGAKVLSFPKAQQVLARKQWYREATAGGRVLQVPLQSTENPNSFIIKQLRNAASRPVVTAVTSCLRAVLDIESAGHVGTSDGEEAASSEPLISADSEIPCASCRGTESIGRVVHCPSCFATTHAKCLAAHPRWSTDGDRDRAGEREGATASGTAVSTVSCSGSSLLPGEVACSLCNAIVSWADCLQLRRDVLRRLGLHPESKVGRMRERKAAKKDAGHSGRRVQTGARGDDPSGDPSDDQSSGRRRGRQGVQPQTRLVPATIRDGHAR